jgi:hypothetical protein
MNQAGLNNSSWAGPIGVNDNNYDQTAAEDKDNGDSM